MNKYLMRAMQTSPDEFTELGEALDGSVAVVDWTGTGGSDILYNANPRFFGGGTYLYREDQRFQNTIPVYKPAEFLEGIEGRYCIPLPTDEKTGFYLLTLKDDCLMLYRNIGPRSNPVFEASKEKVLCMEELLKKLLPLFFHGFRNMPGRDYGNPASCQLLDGSCKAGSFLQGQEKHFA
jgi:hypothetical protein